MPKEFKKFVPTKETLEEAKQFLRDNWIEGAICPCCKQMVKLYKRKLNAGMAMGLITIYRIAPNKDYIHVPTEFTKRKINAADTEYPKLAHWGLIEEQPNDTNPEKKTSGFWRITDRGIDFVLRKISLQQYLHIYNGSPHSFAGGQINITKALADKFDYNQLMNG